MRNLKEKTLIKKINKIIPTARAFPLSEFYDNPGVEGIWFKGSEDSEINGLPLYNPYCEFGINRDTGGIHIDLYKILEDAGWYPEPYDSGTLMAYPC
jgi:hypothetical protein